MHLGVHDHEITKLAELADQVAREFAVLVQGVGACRDPLVDPARNTPLEQAVFVGQEGIYCLPRCFSRSAMTIFSGVTGYDVNQIPVASWIALTMEGGALTIAPSDASLAPNGPSGSSVMTCATLISGASVESGMR
ncbi:MAG: hypothetical protein A3I00_00535 [Betaproteobacteria bacterium RIFCSPLOWO2_02_FULL_64_12]|nr:MAG: hypothetical protein A3I00_00535 [Betaproteobacteria bacterium RIFCSPLOWO2_02_FULL_64_12]